MTEFKRNEAGKYFPNQPYVSLKQEAISETFKDLSPDERVAIDRLIERVMGLKIRNMGKVSALELIGSIAIKLVESQQPGSNR